MNRYTGFWSEVFGYTDPPCEVSPPVVIISDVFWCWTHHEFMDTVGTILKILGPLYGSWNRLLSDGLLFLWHTYHKSSQNFGFYIVDLKSTLLPWITIVWQKKTKKNFIVCVLLFNKFFPFFLYDYFFTLATKRLAIMYVRAQILWIILSSLL